MVHPITVPLFTPVQTKSPWTFYPALYLSPNCKSVAVLSDPLQVDEKGSKGCLAKPYERSMLATVAIVISYCTLIFPLLAVIATIAARGWISGFYYLPGKEPQALSSDSGTKEIPSKVEGFAAFQRKCLGAEQYLEKLYTQGNADLLASKYIQQLMDERISLLKKVFPLGGEAQSEMNFLQTISEKILLKLIERDKQYADTANLKERDSIQSNYEKGKKEINDRYIAKLKAHHAKLKEPSKAPRFSPVKSVQKEPGNRLKTIFSPVKSVQKEPANRLKKGLTHTIALQPKSSVKREPAQKLVCTTFPHVISDSTYTELRIFQQENGKMSVKLSSVLFGNARSVVFPHEKIVWKTKQSVGNISNPRSWSLNPDNLTVIYNGENQ